MNRKKQKKKRKQNQKTAEERSQGLGLHFGKGYIVHLVDALLVNEPGVEGGQVEDETFLKLFSKDKKTEEMRLTQSLNKRGEHTLNFHLGSSGLKYYELHWVFSLLRSELVGISCKMLHIRQAPGRDVKQPGLLTRKTFKQEN